MEVPLASATLGEERIVTGAELQFHQMEGVRAFGAADFWLEAEILGWNLSPFRLFEPLAYPLDRRAQPRLPDTVAGFLLDHREIGGHSRSTLPRLVKQPLIRFAHDGVDFVPMLLGIVQQFSAGVRLVEIAHVNGKRFLAEQVKDPVVGPLLVGG